jgi:hypothetical protein
MTEITEIQELNFYQKLNLLQLELKAPKAQYNNFGKYKYRSCEDILDSVKSLLKKYGFILLVSDELKEASGRFYIQAKATLTDGNTEISTTSYAREPLSKKGMDESQITGCASSYARKYALNGLLCIDDNKDSDYFESVEDMINKDQEEALRDLISVSPKTEEEICKLMKIDKLADLPLKKLKAIEDRLKSLVKDNAK